jgi:Novel STAND NTPase 3
MGGLQDLGWLQFERLCALLLEAEAGIAEPQWDGAADRIRTLISLEPVRFAGHTVAPPVTVRCAWVRGNADTRAVRLAELRAVEGSTLTFVNAELEADHPVIGEAELLAAIDRHPEVRLRLPSVLALRPTPSPNGSTLDIAAAAALAEVFVPTLAYDRALTTLQRHHFAVLTGPPEMGKTAIARMLGLALLSDGWEAHECTRPEQVHERLDPDKPQIFIADDAFGSTEYRPDAAERWARELDDILRALGERTWLVWTSRPAPLRAGLRHRVPQVLVDASSLAVDEKTLILFRHARAADLGRDQRERVWQHGHRIVEHPHFTPERIRRFVGRGLHSDDLAAAIEAELAEPTEAMHTSYAALEPEHRELLMAMLDCPSGPVSERDLAAALRRHTSSPLSHAPVELVDGVADHFLRVIA